MAGHNKWSKVKRLKGALDAKRGQIFSRLAKEIALAAKLGGGDPDGNVRLRAAVQAARAENMPNDNIARAIKRGTGELEGGQIEEMTYEAYGPGGVALLIEVATDNKNRTAADLRHVLSKNHGNLGSSGSVAYLFHRRGQIVVPAESIGEEALLEKVIEAGGDEMESDVENHLILTAPDRLYPVAEALRSGGVAVASSKLVFVPGTLVPVTDPALAAQVIRLCDALDESEDVQQVHSNADIPEPVLAGLEA